MEIDRFGKEIKKLSDSVLALAVVAIFVTILILFSALIFLLTPYVP
jgi:hypothetical protein